MRKSMKALLALSLMLVAQHTSAREMQTRFVWPANPTVQANPINRPLVRDLPQQAQRQCCVSAPCGSYCATTINGVCVRTETKYCTRCWC